MSMIYTVSHVFLRGHLLQIIPLKDAGCRTHIYIYIYTALHNNLYCSNGKITGVCLHFGYSQSINILYSKRQIIVKQILHYHSS